MSAGVGASEQERLRPLFELLVSVVIFKAEQLAAVQPGGMLDPRLFVCLDEAGNCAAIKKLPQLATTGRGQGIQLLTIWHDEAQLQHRYGHRASTVLNGHRAKLLSVLLFAAAGTGRSMADVARWVDVQDVDDVATALMEIGNQQALDAWAACTSRPDNTMGSVYGTAETLLDVYGDPVIAASAEGWTWTWTSC